MKVTVDICEEQLRQLTSGNHVCSISSTLHPIGTQLEVNDRFYVRLGAVTKKVCVTGVQDLTAHTKMLSLKLIS